MGFLVQFESLADTVPSKRPTEPTAGPVIQVGTTGQTALKPGALEPSWILTGNPTTRSLPLAEADDGNLSCGLWDCTAGTFNFYYSCDEIVHILEGEVIVREAGATYMLRAGDVAFFPQGLTTVWTVPVYVKKFCIFRSKPRSFLRRIGSFVKRCLRFVHFWRMS